MTKRIKLKSDGNIALYVSGGLANSDILLSDIIEAINKLNIDIAKLKSNMHQRGPHDIIFRPEEPISKQSPRRNQEMTPERKAKRDDLAEILGQKPCPACIGSGMAAWEVAGSNANKRICKKCNGTGYLKEKK